MSDPSRTTKRPWSRFQRFGVIALLMGLAFGLGVTITAVIAAQLLFPVAAIGMTMGLASASLNSISNALNNGNSQQHLTVLLQLKDSLSTVTNPDPNLAAWIASSVEKCRTDKDPSVVDLAEEIMKMIANKSPTELK